MRIISLLLPIVIYFVVSWYLSPLWASVIAGGISLAQMLFVRFVMKRWSWSYLVDVALVVVLGVVEWLTEDFSQRIMWIMLPLLVVLFLVLSLTTRFDFLKVLSGGLLNGVLTNPYANYALRRSEKRMIAWCLFAALFGVVAAVNPESEIAAWVDSWLLLTILLGYFATEIIVGRLNRKRYKNSEWVPLMTEDGKVIGSSPRELVHNGSHWLHPVVHLHVFCGGKLLLQLRPKTKKIQPSRWDTAVGGHITDQEKIEEALKREVWEEIGLHDFTAKLVMRYVWKCEVEHEFVFSFVTESNGPFETKNKGEVDELRLWSKKQIETSLGKNIFTPNLEYELRTWLLNSEWFENC